MRKILSLCLIVIVIITITNTTKVNAHEMYYTGSAPNYNGINLKWNTLSNGKAYLQINGDYLVSGFSSAYNTARYMWSSYVSSKISIDQATFGASTVTVSTTTQSWWNTKFGGAGGSSLIAREILGYCENKSTDGVIITSTETAQLSNKKLRYATIYISPYNDFSSENHKMQVIVHEIGHALGLGHNDYIYYPSTDDSVMKRSGYHGYYTPRTHDITDINNKY